jgi:hypothetical protein
LDNTRGNLQSTDELEYAQKKNIETKKNFLQRHVDSNEEGTESTDTSAMDKKTVKRYSDVLNKNWSYIILHNR